MFGTAFARELQNVEMAGEVGAGVGTRVLQRIAHAGLRAEVDDAGEALPLQRAFQRRLVREIAFGEAKGIARLPVNPRHPVPLEADGVVIVEIVDPGHPVAARAKRFGQGRTDEACRSGNQYIHAMLPFGRGP